MTLKILTRITGRHVQCTSSLCYWPFFLQIIRGKVIELSNYIQRDILGCFRGNLGVKLQFKLPSNFGGDIVLLQFLGRCFGLDTWDTFCTQRALGSKYELLILFFIVFLLLCPLCSRATLLIYVFPEVHLQFFGASMLSLDFFFFIVKLQGAEIHSRFFNCFLPNLDCTVRIFHRFLEVVLFCESHCICTYLPKYLTMSL